MTLPCSLCGEEIDASLTVCPECQGDPAADYAPCLDCDGTGRRVETVFHRMPFSTRYVPGEPEEGPCTTCDGEGRGEAPYAIAREQAIATGRAA